MLKLAQKGMTRWHFRGFVIAKIIAVWSCFPLSALSLCS